MLLSNTISPANVTISSTAVNYTFQYRPVTSREDLPKPEQPLVTMNIPGTFSGSTVISNGTLSLGANQTFGSLSGNNGDCLVGAPAHVHTKT